MGVNKTKQLIQGVTIAELRSKGMSCRDIADHLDVSYRQVARRLKDSDVKEILDKTIKFYALHAEEVADRLIDLTSDKIPAIRLKSIEQFYKVLGITTPHPPVLINHMYQDNRQAHFQPHIQVLIDTQTDNSIKGEIIE